jgi:glutaredoxin
VNHIAFFFEPSLERCITMSRAVFYHAGCPVCFSAEQTVADSLKGDVEKVHLGEQSGRVAEAEAAGVKSVPALVINGQPFHINHGADLSALKS